MRFYTNSKIANIILFLTLLFSLYKLAPKDFSSKNEPVKRRFNVAQSNREATAKLDLVEKELSKSSDLAVLQQPNVEAIEELQWWQNMTFDPEIVTKHCHYNLDIRHWAPGKNLKACCPPNTSTLIRSGNWEGNLQSIVFNSLFPLVSPNAAFIDIGGLIGVYTLSAARLGRKVFTFEPFWTFEYIKSALIVNGLTDKVYLYKVALLDSTHCAILTTPDKGPEFGRMVVKEDRNCSNLHKQVKVAILDQLLPTFRREKIQQAVIKIDIEGSEAKAILGGSKLLQEIDIPFIQMEVDKTLKKLNENGTQEKKLVEKFLEMMKQLNYVASPMSKDWKTKRLNMEDVSHWPADVLWHKKSAF